MTDFQLFVSKKRKILSADANNIDDAKAPPLASEVLRELCLAVTRGADICTKRNVCITLSAY